MRATNIIAKKRDGGALTDAEIAWFIADYTKGELPDYQASAFLMAVYLNGMNAAETASLTAAMVASGEQLDLTDLLPGRNTLDKHSTGGVGDKTTLVVVPILAAAGLSICKMSGRGLGHTGGTLDKLEAIPGFTVDLSSQQMVEQVEAIGACLVGQTGDIAPADKKLYALRDATATVGSLPLIVGSILSKKLAGGASRFLFDVKVGRGALMKDLSEARALATALVEGAKRHNRPAVAVLSDMSQPLGYAIGNALEIAEAISVLTPGASPDRVVPRFRQLCVSLAAEGLLLSGLSESRDEAELRAAALLENGSALAVFRRLVAAQNGDTRVVDDPDRLPKAPVVHPVLAREPGYVQEMDAAALGEIVVGLGGGRARKEDRIDPAVGVTLNIAVGTEVTAGQPLLQIHAATDEAAQAAETRVREAFTIGPEPYLPLPPLIYEVVWQGQ